MIYYVFLLSNIILQKILKKLSFLNFNKIFKTITTVLYYKTFSFYNVIFSNYSFVGYYIIQILYYLSIYNDWQKRFIRLTKVSTRFLRKNPFLYLSKFNFA